MPIGKREGEKLDENMASNRFKLVSAVHLFLFQEDRVLLLRRFNTGYEDGSYSVIAGHLNGGEQIKTAAIREALEEVGIVVSPSDLQVVGVMHRLSDDERIDWFLAASVWSGEITNQEPDKCDQLAWFEIDSLPENVIPYVRRALNNFRYGRWYDSFGWVERQTQ
jgi:8-oxo-dGTP diphosphatase